MGADSSDVPLGDELALCLRPLSREGELPQMMAIRVACSEDDDVVRTEYRIPRKLLEEQIGFFRTMFRHDWKVSIALLSGNQRLLTVIRRRSLAL